MTARGERWRSVLTYLAIAALVVTGARWALYRYVLEPPMPMSPLGRADWVEVWVRDEKQKPVTDSATVAALVAFADEVRHGWHDTWHTRPAPPVRACYFRHFRGDRMRLQCIGAGCETLTVWGDEPWGIQSATPEQTRRFAALAGVPDTMLDRW